MTSGDIVAPAAVKILEDAHHAAGIQFDPAVERDQWCRQLLANLATWSYAPPNSLRAEDSRSRELNQRVVQLASKLREALSDARAHAEEREQQPDSDKVETCKYYLPSDKRYMEVDFEIAKIEFSAANADYWVHSSGRGRPKLWVYYGFVHQLHLIFTSMVSNRGFVERDGTAVGRFVKLVHAAQAILPPAYRHCDVRTTGNRVLQALAEEMPEIR